MPPLRLWQTMRAMGLFIGLCWSSQSTAMIDEVIDYLKQYQLGFDYTNSQNMVNLTYQTATKGSPARSCVATANEPTKQTCSVQMYGGGSNGPGIVLQKAFQRQGQFYFHASVSSGARYLSGSLLKADQSLDGLPLRSADFSLLAIVLKPYIQFGITPEHWPDLLISMGPALQGAFGKVHINDESANVAVGTSSITGPFSLLSGFLELELVVWRFGDGAFSFFISHDVTGNGVGSKFYPQDVDGMSEFHGAFSHNVKGGSGPVPLGMKLILNWP